MELTLVVYEEGGKYQAMTPSITIAKSSILSIEEKFQGGTGMNITPPSLLLKSSQVYIQETVAGLSSRLGMTHYTRMDFFFNQETTEIIIIEMNSLPALTPSTVLYHQMLDSGYADTPTQGIERLINTSISKKNQFVLST